MDAVLSDFIENFYLQEVDYEQGNFDGSFDP